MKRKTFPLNSQLYCVLMTTHIFEVENIYTYLKPSLYMAIIRCGDAGIVYEI